MNNLSTDDIASSESFQFQAEGTSVNLNVQQKDASNAENISTVADHNDSHFQNPFATPSDPDIQTHRPDNHTSKKSQTLDLNGSAHSAADHFVSNITADMSDMPAAISAMPDTNAVPDDISDISEIHDASKLPKGIASPHADAVTHIHISKHIADTQDYANISTHGKALLELQTMLPGTMIFRLPGTKIIRLSGKWCSTLAKSILTGILKLSCHIKPLSKDLAIQIQM